MEEVDLFKMFGAALGQAFLVARVPTVRCTEHGVHLAAVPGARPGSRFTLLMGVAMAVSAPTRRIKAPARGKRTPAMKAGWSVELHRPITFDRLAEERGQPHRGAT